MELLRGLGDQCRRSVGEADNRWRQWLSDFYIGHSGQQGLLECQLFRVLRKLGPEPPDSMGRCAVAKSWRVNGYQICNIDNLWIVQTLIQWRDH